MQISNLLPLAPKAVSTPGANNADRTAASTWFDGELPAAGTHIAADLASGSRGLGVAQHATQVLSHLCAEPDERA